MIESAHVVLIVVTQIMLKKTLIKINGPSIRKIEEAMLMTRALMTEAHHLIPLIGIGMRGDNLEILFHTLLRLHHGLQAGAEESQGSTWQFLA